ncbi:MAG: NADH-quinone oxidoreductase subunit NuoH [Planctomycetota bacterium]|nr:NADH-quinone oxidoreductase subunit NuoH [Planctomycetota bacterium]
MDMLISVLVILAKITCIFGGVITLAALTTLAERKVSAWIQFRHGPNRVGPWGILQPLADGVKFIYKEELVPDGANQVMFYLAPAMVAMPAMMGIAVLPFAAVSPLYQDTGPLAIANLDLSVLFILAFSGLSIYGVILGGWASNSKFSLLGALRASAQMISYELALLLSVAAILLMAGSANLVDIANDQQGSIFNWYIWKQPLAFLLFLIATFAETNRHPFDFAECEPELVAGFHTEYSSMRFALFFLGEYCAIIVMCAMTCTFFLGGFHVPFWADAPWFVQAGMFLAKICFFLFLFIWVRWTLPRFRFDQLMGLGWKTFLPLALLNLFVTGALVAAGVY